MPIRVRTALLLIGLLTPLCVSQTTAGEWPSWRGPTGTGVAEGGGYPLEWDDEKNVAWKIQLPGPGGSTPVVTGDHIFLTLNSDGSNMLCCYSMQGEEIWKQELGSEEPGKHKKATGANPSPVTDGQHVYAYFKSGDLGCFTLDGELVWRIDTHQQLADINTETLWWDYGSSPVLTKDAVVVTCMQSGPSYIAALDKQSGKLLWRADRNLDAPREAAQSYSTPAVVDLEDGSQILVVLGADHVTAHSASDGSELWRVGGLNPTGHEFFRSIASPVVADGIVVAPYARGESLTGIRMGGSGDVTGSHVAYTNEATSADVPTPAVRNGRIFVCRDKQRGTIDCLDLKTGETIWTGSLPKHRESFSASPVVADGRLYVTREDGTVFVLDADGDEFRLLAQNSIGSEFTVATPVFVDGRILLRTHSALRLIAAR